MPTPFAEALDAHLTELDNESTPYQVAYSSNIDFRYDVVEHEPGWLKVTHTDPQYAGMEMFVNTDVLFDVVVIET